MAKVTIILEDVEMDGNHGVQYKTASVDYEGRSPKEPPTNAMMVAMTLHRLYTHGVIGPMIPVVCQDYLTPLKEVEAKMMAEESSPPESGVSPET